MDSKKEHGDYASILHLALPSIVSNITVPLLGLVDLAIVGHMGNELYIGAIAIGSMIFNVMYWLFGFLRMGTSGMTAQAVGRKSADDIMQMLWRTLIVGCSIGILFTLLQSPLGALTQWLMQVQPSQSSLVSVYFTICICGSPAVLGLYGLNGWFVGMQNTRIPMIVSIVQNVVNILLSLLFVYVLDMKIEGVAFGTLIAQWTAFVLALFLAYRLCQLQLPNWIYKQYTFRQLFSREKMSEFFTVNRNIFLRTLCLVAVNMYFTSSGSAQGTMTLAVNSLLMTLYLIFSYFIDGFAFAGEALCGKAWGMMQTGSDKQTTIVPVTRRLLKIGFGLAVGFTLLYYIGGEAFLSLLTDNENVVAAAMPYMPLVAAVPLASFVAFTLDGVFIGITHTRDMLISCAVAMLLFFIIDITAAPYLGNTALWTAYLVFMIARGAVLWMAFHRV